MGKKIKISEDQLMRLMENKTKQINEDESLNEIGLGIVEWGLAKMVAPMIIEKLKESAEDLRPVNLGIFTRALEHELNQHLKHHENHDESSMEDMDEVELETGGGEDMGMDDEGMGMDSVDNLDFPEDEIESDEMLSESVKAYRSEFDRYMKGPKI